MIRILALLPFLCLVGLSAGEAEPKSGPDDTSASGNVGPAPGSSDDTYDCNNGNPDPSTKKRGDGTDGGTTTDITEYGGDVGEGETTSGSCTDCYYESRNENSDPNPPYNDDGVSNNCSSGLNLTQAMSLVTGNPAAGGGAVGDMPSMTEAGGCGSCGGGARMALPSGNLGAHRGLPLTRLHYWSRDNVGGYPMADHSHSFDVVLTQSYDAATSVTTISVRLPNGGVRPTFTTTDGLAFNSAIAHNGHIHGSTCLRDGDQLTVRGPLGHQWRFTLPAGWSPTQNGLKLRPTLMQDPWAHPVTLTYDANGRIQEARSLLGAVTFTWGDVGGSTLVTSITEPDGRTTTYEYQTVLGKKRLSAMVHADGSRSTYATNATTQSLPGYDMAYTVRTEHTPNLAPGRARTRTYWTDSVGRVALVEDGLNRDMLWRPASNSTGGKIWRVFQRPDGSLHIPITVSSAFAQAKVEPGRDRAERFATDSSKRIVRRTDEFGRTTTYAWYGQTQYPTSIVHPDGTTESWERQPGTAQPLAHTDRLGRTTRATRDAQGNITATIFPDDTPETDVDNPRETHQYNDAAQLVRTVDAAGRTTDYFYTTTGQVADATATVDDPANHGFLVRVVRPGDAAGATEVWTYRWDAAHLDCVEATDPGGHTVTWTYDALHRVIRTDWADGSFATRTYGSPADPVFAGLVTATRDRNGRTTTYAYDASGRRTATVLPDGTRQDVVFDERGRPASRTNAGDLTVLGYDAVGRQTATTRQASASHALTTTTIFDPRDRTIATTDAYGRTAGVVYDVNDRPIRQVQGLVPGAVSWTASQAGVEALLSDMTYVSTDIGQSTYTGSTTVSGSTVTLTGYGRTMAWGSDVIRFHGVPFPGEGSLTCRVDESSGGMAGLMIRASSSPTAPFIFVGVHPTYGDQVTERAFDGVPPGCMRYAATSDPSATPRWIRLTRSSHIITAWTSSDGVTWTARWISAIPMQADAVAGVFLAPTSGSQAWLSGWDTATLTDLSLSKTTVLANVRAIAWKQYLLGLPRLTTANPAYVISEQSYDSAGQLLAMRDGNGVPTTFTYDVRGRQITRTEAAETTPATTTFGYDVVGNRTSVTSPRGVQTAMTYTNRDLLASVTEAANVPAEATLVRLMTYTATRKLWQEWDANNASKAVNDPTRVATVYGYGGCCDRLKQIWDASGNLTSFLYDFVGNRTHVTDPNTLTTVTTYDARNRVATVTNAANETTTFTYDDNLTDGVGIDAISSVIAVLPSLGLGAGADGSAVAVMNPEGETSYELRDGLGRTLARIDPLGHTTRVAYDTVIASGDGVGLVEAAMTSPTGHVTRSQADGAGLVRRSIDALGNVATSGFDAVGNQLTFRDANQVGWNASYNGRNWLLSRSDTRPTETNVTDWGYDFDGNRVTETNALGKTESYLYDHRNRRTQITDRLNGITRFSYDAVGNLTAISDADNEARGGLAHVEGCTQYAYDPRNLLVAEAFPAGQTGRTLRAYGYDAGRRLTTRDVGVLTGAFSATAVPGNAESTTYQYDTANRLTTRGYPADGKNDTFDYDDASRLISAVSARYASTVTRTYDGAGRLDDESLTLANVQLTGTTVGPATWTVGYSYDADNRVTGLSYPTGSTVTRTYTDRDELDTVGFNGQQVIDRTYDASGRLTQSALGNGLTETRSYISGTYLPASIAIPSVTGFTYTFDAAQRKLTEGDGIRSTTQSFGYDDAGRLTAWDEGASTQSWNLSLVGDWTSTTRNGVPEPRIHTKVHEATQVGPNILTYDLKGNLTKDEKQTALAWDPENRLIRAVVTPDASPSGFGAVAVMRYDALGRRVAKTVQNRTTYFLPAGAQTVVEIEQTAVPSQAQVDGAEADGTLANAALAPASGGILPGTSGPITRVNFQPQTTLIPTGFLADTGKFNAVRTNGLTYGWSSDATAQAVICHGAVPLVEFDTHIQLAQGQSWTIALPNGTYPVVVVAGDPLSTQQTNNLTINGQTLTDPDPAANPGYSAGDFDGWAVLVTVTNGTLTIAPAVGALEAKVCFVEIGAVGTTITTETQDKLAGLITRATSETGANPPSTDPVTKEFVYGDYVDEVVAYTQKVGNDATARYYPHFNHLYSVAALTDSTGAVVERYQYDAYGKQKITDAGGNVTRTKSTVGWDRGFTGYITDNETGLLHARARQYSPTLGRFVSRDPWDYYEGPSLYSPYFIPHGVDPMGTGTPVIIYNEPNLNEAGGTWTITNITADATGPSIEGQNNSLIKTLIQLKDVKCCKRILYRQWIRYFAFPRGDDGKGAADGKWNAVHDKPDIQKPNDGGFYNADIQDGIHADSPNTIFQELPALKQYNDDKKWIRRKLFKTCAYCVDPQPEKLLGCVMWTVSSGDPLLAKANDYRYPMIWTGGIDGGGVQAPKPGGDDYTPYPLPEKPVPAPQNKPGEIPPPAEPVPARPPGWKPFSQLNRGQ